MRRLQTTMSIIPKKSHKTPFKLVSESMLLSRTLDFVKHWGKVFKEKNTTTDDQV